MDGKQLRNSILQWAIQGKLVPQDPNDEPASVLLERIREEKARLVKEKKIKRDKNESIIYRGDDNSYYEKFTATGEVKCIDDEIPFELPNTWCWVRLDNVITLLSGRDLEPSQYNNLETGIPYMTGASNFLNEDLIVNRWTLFPATISHIGELLITCKGTIGTMAFNSIGDIHIARQIMSISSKYINLNYLKLYLEIYVSELEKAARSIIPGISRNDILTSVFPVPPLNEQARIVEFIKSITPSISLFGKKHTELIQLNDTVKPTLKKSILQEAIQGRLVAQCETDEPASVLLDKIRAEKKSLVKEGKLKKSALEDSVIFKGDDNKYFEKCGKDLFCIDDEIPFEIPNSWEWVRFGSLINMRMGKTPARGDVNYWTNGKTPWVSISDMFDYGIIKNTKEKVSDFAIQTAFGGNIVPKGTLIMSFKLTVGRTSLLDIDAVHNEAIISIRPYVDKEDSLRDYLFYVLPLISNFGDSKDAIKGKTLNSTSLFNLLIPLPPLAEQKRIVTAIVTAWQVL